MRIAVTGAAGRVGGRVATLLRGRADVVPLTRRVADYDDPPALRQALGGVEVLVLVGSDGEADRMLRHHHNLVEAAAAGGVSHVVALSSVDADPDSPFCYARVNALTERALRASGDARGAVTTVVRASLFAEFLASLVADATRDGVVRLPAGDGRIGLVARDDVARCLAACALGGGVGGVHRVTGPASLPLPDLVAPAGLAYTPTTEADYARELAGRQTPWWAYAYTGLLASVRQGRWDLVTDDVRRLTGREPTPVGLR